MIIVRLTGANPLVRLWAVQQMLQSRSPANLQTKVQILHSPDNDETLLLIDSTEYEEKENVSYLESMPIMHTRQFTTDEYEKLAQAATATAIDMESAKKQIIAALKSKEEIAVVVSLEKQQLDFSSKFAAALREIADRSKDDPDFISRIVEFCIADLVKKKVLPGMQAVRQMQRINKFIIALTASGQVEPWLKQQGISFKKQEQCNFSRSVVLPAHKTKPASIIFDSVAGQPNEGAALHVDDMLGLASVLLRSYELFHTAEHLGKTKPSAPKSVKTAANSDNKPTIPTKPQRRRVANSYN